MKLVLIEGWRGVHQSLAMANQYQLYELAKFDSIQLRHRDLPFSSPNWNKPENAPGFPPAMENVVMSIQAPAEGEAFDAAYRIAMPFAQSTAPAKRRITYIISEFGLRDYQFAERERAPKHFCSGGDLVVTPSNWSRMKLVEYGIPDDGIRVIPHGVSSDIFHPLSVAERSEARGELDIADDEFVFLNVGSLTLEKGVDLLIQAFAIVHQRHPRARLMLKDTSGLYGLTLEDFIVKYIEHFGPIRQEVLAAIGQVPSSLSLAEMRRLYGAADAYVSPYRAEGFNLPVIEAIACGTPAIVTRGGATDDFCDSETAQMVDADRVSNLDREFYGNEKLPGYHLEPRIDSLISQMERALMAPMALQPSFLDARQRLVERFSWAAAARSLTELF
jgi:glycosyltransferase involved in cell wall biosynthesis